MARGFLVLYLLVGLAGSVDLARAESTSTPSLNLPALRVHPNTAFTLNIEATAEYLYGVELAFLVDASKIEPDVDFIRYCALASDRSVVHWNVVGDTVFVSLASDTPVSLTSSTLVALAFRTRNTVSDETVSLTWVGFPNTNINESAVTLSSGQIAFPVPVQGSASPVSFSLLPNTPNPFNPSTTLRFVLPEAGHVCLSVYDITGAPVRTLVDRPLTAGSHLVLWDGRDEMGREAASGTYLARLVAPPGEVTRKMVLLR